MSVFGFSCSHRTTTRTTSIGLSYALRTASYPTSRSHSTTTTMTTAIRIALRRSCVGRWRARNESRKFVFQLSLVLSSVAADRFHSSSLAMTRLRFDEPRTLQTNATSNELTTDRRCVESMSMSTPNNDDDDDNDDGRFYLLTNSRACIALFGVFGPLMSQTKFDRSNNFVRI